MRKVLVLSKEGCQGCAAFMMLLKTDKFLASSDIEIHKKEDEDSMYGELVDKHGVQSLPTFIYLDGDNEVIEVKSGFNFAEDKRKLNNFFSEE